MKCVDVLAGQSQVMWLSCFLCEDRSGVKP